MLSVLRLNLPGGKEAEDKKKELIIEEEVLRNR